MLAAGALAATLGANPVLGGAPEISGEATVAPGLLAMTAPVSCHVYAEVATWAGQHGYRLPPGEGLCRRGPDSAAVALGWNAAAIWANALSERAGLQPAYRDPKGSVARDGGALAPVPRALAGTDGYRLPTLSELGLPRLRASMSGDIQEWTTSRIDLGDGRPYYYLCKPGACDFHSPGMSGRGVGFRLVRPEPARRHS